jgi:DNA-binding NtrC family response regulator
MTSKHVLIVDDDPLILEVMVRALASKERRISTARRVSAARDLLSREAVDLIITDARIPGEHGLQLAEAANDLGIATIIMSGEPEWAAAHGVAPGQYLAKPFDLRTLARLVEACLARVPSRPGEPASPSGTASTA